MSNPTLPLNRRDFLTTVSAAAVAATMSSSVEGAAGGFPKGFLWGAATAGHQVEGNNINSDIWLLENIKPTLFVEPSGDACDNYHRYEEDLRLLRTLGFNTYRFSLEWSRIEPEPGRFSVAELDHYRRVLQACRANGLKTFVTFNHFTTPRWFAALGGWENPEAAAHFAAYCSRSTAHLGDLIDFAVTLNEPNLIRLLRWLNLPKEFAQIQSEMRKRAAVASGSDRFSCLFTDDPERVLAPMIENHQRGIQAIKAVRADLPVGVSLAMTDEQAVGADSKRDEMQADVYGAWFAATDDCDFVGVQTYTRNRVDAQGVMPKPAGAELTQMGDEFYPEALEAAIRHAHAATGKPIYVTENGIATENDARRVEYIRRALAGVHNCLRDGLPVRGYIHWSLLDNFEWTFGYRMKFGLVSVDRKTFARTPKPSARYLGTIARANDS